MQISPHTKDQQSRNANEKMRKQPFQYSNQEQQRPTKDIKQEHLNQLENKFA